MREGKYRERILIQISKPGLDFHMRGWRNYHVWQKQKKKVWQKNIFQLFFIFSVIALVMIGILFSRGLDVKTSFFYFTASLAFSFFLSISVRHALVVRSKMYKEEQVRILKITIRSLEKIGHDQDKLIRARALLEKITAGRYYQHRDVDDVTPSHPLVEGMNEGVIAP